MDVELYPSLWKERPLGLNDVSVFMAVPQHLDIHKMSNDAHVAYSAMQNLCALL